MSNPSITLTIKITLTELDVKHILARHLLSEPLEDRAQILAALESSDVGLVRFVFDEIKDHGIPLPDYGAHNVVGDIDPDCSALATRFITMTRIIQSL